MSAWIEREEDYEASLNRGALWAVTYGDLMSYLTIFFLILYASVTTKSMSIQMSMQGVEEQFGKESTVIDELFSREGIQKIAKLEVGEDKMRVVFNSPVLFQPGGAELREDSLPHIRKLARALSELPNAIQIEGHTDDIPLGPSMPFNSNWELSAARAFSVLRAFEKAGVPSNRLSAIGYGEFRPLRSNDTREGRAANRRIEVNLMRQRE
jgi:chemotaxis protein MotB